MTPSERSDFLAAGRIGVLSVADLTPAGATLAVPIWYRYEPEVGLTVLTSPMTKKGRAIDANGRFTFTVSDATGYQYVMVEGPVVDHGLSSLAELTRMSVEQLGKSPGERYAPVWAGAGNGEHTYVMTPQRWYSADVRAEMQSFGAPD